MANVVWTEVANCLCTHECLFQSCEGNINITLKWEHKQFVTTVYTLFIYLFYLLHNITRSYMIIKETISTCRLRVPLSLSDYVLGMTSHSIAQYIIGPNNCYASMSEVLSYLLDIRLIHADTHDRSYSRCVSWKLVDDRPVNKRIEATKGFIHCFEFINN